jgi:hypothetical protein
MVYAVGSNEYVRQPICHLLRNHLIEQLVRLLLDLVEFLELQEFGKFQAISKRL